MRTVCEKNWLIRDSHYGSLLYHLRNELQEKRTRLLQKSLIRSMIRIWVIREWRSVRFQWCRHLEWMEILYFATRFEHETVVHKIRATIGNSWQKTRSSDIVPGMLCCSISEIHKSFAVASQLKMHSTSQRPKNSLNIGLQVYTK